MYKIKRRWLPIYIVLLTATIIIAGGLIYLYYKTGSFDYLSTSLLVALFSSYILWSMVKIIRIKVAPKRLVVMVRCMKCGYSEERGYNKGDFIFKNVGECPKCQSPTLYIAGIYVKGGEEIGQKAPRFLLFRNLQPLLTPIVLKPSY